MTTIFEVISPDINYEVSTYLDYDSRINFNRVLSPEDRRHTVKINADSHFMLVFTNEVFRLVGNINDEYQYEKQLKRLSIFMKIIKLILSNNGIMFMEHSSVNFVNVMKVKTQEALDVINLHEENDLEKEREIAIVFQSKMDSIVLKKPIKAKLVNVYSQDERTPFKGRHGRSPIKTREA